MTPISGDPDLVISFNISNKFPDRDNYDLVSENNFTTDSLVLDPQTYPFYAKKYGRPVTQVYIGVYTMGRNSTYTIVVNKKAEFHPIMLQNG